MLFLHSSAQFSFEPPVTHLRIHLYTLSFVSHSFFAQICVFVKTWEGLGWADQLVIWSAPELVISAFCGAHLTDDFISETRRGDLVMHRLFPTR